MHTRLCFHNVGLSCKLRQRDREYCSLYEHGIYLPKRAQYLGLYEYTTEKTD